MALAAELMDSLFIAKRCALMGAPLRPRDLIVQSKPRRAVMSEEDQELDEDLDDDLDEDGWEEDSDEDGF
jgi:hypothetical protein